MLLLELHALTLAARPYVLLENYSAQLPLLTGLTHTVLRHVYTQ